MPKHQPDTSTSRWKPTTRSSKRNNSPEPMELDSQKTTENNAPKCRKSQKSKGIVKIQTIYSPEKSRSNVTRAEVHETEDLVKSHFEDVKKEYDEAVKKEVKTSFRAWQKTMKECEGVSIYRRHLLKLCGHVATFTRPNPSPEDNCHAPEAVVTWVKPDRDETGKVMKKVRVHCTRIEIGDVMPQMIYWVPIENSIAQQDQLRLTHMPYFNDIKEDQDIYDHLITMFPDGIHGFSENWSYINDWILYKVFRKSLETFRGNPDVLYYTLYRLWPNKFSQRELSEVFPKLCRKFAEVGFDPNSLEPWKISEIVKPAENLRRPECYSCLSLQCVYHGFKAEIPAEYPHGEFYVVTLPLPNNIQNDRKFCSDSCWKMVTMDEAMKALEADSDEISQKQVTIYIQKSKLTRMPVENGGLIANNFVFKSSIPFCVFSKMAVDPEDDECNINSCREAYRLIMGLAEEYSDRRILVNRPSARLSIKDRVHNFRRDQANQEKIKRKHRHEKLRIQALEEGLDVAKLIAEDDKREAERNAEKIRLQAVTPISSCRHMGPCNLSAENCACRENGVCSYMCKCDINCPQRFPGCNCSPGQCYTKACQCFRANWECNPSTCIACRCDKQDLKGPKCRNYGMLRMVQKRMLVGPSKISGCGLFLLEPAEKDEFITEYVGERISDDEAERRGAIYDRYQCSYIFNLETGGAIDSYKVGNLARFANHDGKNPTCYARTVVVAGEHRIGFYAKRKLETNDELTFDYSYSGEHQVAFRMVDNDKSTAVSKGLKRSHCRKA